MRARLAIGRFLVILFAVVIGHLLWTRWLGPPPVPKYFIGGDVQALVAREPSPRFLYLRKTLHLSQRPTHAWMEVVASDRVKLIVNGRAVAQSVNESLTAGFDADITNSLDIGTNVIAVMVERTTLASPPAAAVTGGYVLSDGEHPIGIDGDWRYSTMSERDGDWWFDKDFDATSWPSPLIAERRLRASVDHPPGSVRAAPWSPWITPGGYGYLNASVQRDFWLPSKPRSAWLRLRVVSSYRLAINGLIVSTEETQLGTGLPPEPAQYTYDITSVLRSGQNTLALVLSTPTGVPRLQADFEIEDSSGTLHRFGSDGAWRVAAGVQRFWQNPVLDNDRGWAPCTVEAGNLGGLAWKLDRDFKEMELPLDESISRAFWEVVLILLVGVVTVYACRAGERYLARCLPNPSARVPLIYWTLLPSTLLAAALQLAIFDPRFMADQIHWRIVIVLLLLAIPIQWRILARRAAPPAKPESQPWRLTNERLLIGVLLIIIVVGAFYLRIRNIAAEPLNPDEVSDYRSTLGFFQHGYPGFAVSDDLPFRLRTTSELTMVGTVLASLIFSDEIWIIRFPAVCFAVATVLLLFHFGRRVFSPSAGLIAAALLAFSPYCVQMANFGRYFSQLQFFVLLTVYFLWKTVRGTGPIDRRALWATTISFIAAYLTWEGVALIGPGFALAAMIHRRGRLETLFKDKALYAVMGVVLLVVAIQLGVRVLAQTQYLVYGTGTADVTLKPMWQYPTFRIWYYTVATAWSGDGIFAMLGLVGAVILSIRHAFRGPVRVLLLIWLSNAWIMSALLPVRAPRYSYHLIPLLLLLIGAVVVAVVHSAMRAVRFEGTPESWQVYARRMSFAFVVALLVYVGGGAVRLDNLKFLNVSGTYSFDQLKFPDMRPAAAYLRRHFQPGDIIISSEPHVLNHIMGQNVTNYFLETRLHLQTILGDSSPQPRHRLGSAEMISSLDSLKDVFARHTRVWYLATPGMNSKVNEPETIAYLRANMDVAVQDSSSVLLLREKNRPASGAVAADRALRRSGTVYLP